MNNNRRPNTALHATGEFRWLVNNRIIGCPDGVVAIAIMLLVLSIAVAANFTSQEVSSFLWECAMRLELHAKLGENPEVELALTEVALGIAPTSHWLLSYTRYWA